MLNASGLRASNRIIYPPTLRFLPIWTLGLLRSSALRLVLCIHTVRIFTPCSPPHSRPHYGRGGGKDVQADERIAAIHWVMQTPLDSLIRLLYPTVYPLHDPSEPWGMLDEQGAVQVKGVP